MSNPSLSHRLVHLGVRPDTDPREVRYIVIANGASWACVTASAVGSVSYLAIGQPQMVAIALTSGVAYGSVLVIGALGYPRAARVVLVAVAVVAIFLSGLLAGPAAGADLYFLAALSAIWLGFPPRDRIVATVATALCVTGMAALRLVGPSVAPLIKFERPDLSRAIAEAVTVALVVSVSVYARRRALAAEDAIDAERARSESLLRNMLPESIAQQLKDAPRAIAQGHDEVTVLFADIVGFTPLSQTMTPHELVRLLNDVFTAFDEMAQRHGLEKIKTIGDAYMVVGGVPNARPDHAAAVAAMALDMRAAVSRFHVGLNLRLGMHTGPAVAGVIGTAKYSYDLWGDTVNTAARMESHGEPGRIHLTAECRKALGDRFAIEERGTIAVKGKGELRTFWLVGAA
jgi:class 3 adenylate cyclase